MSTNQDRRMFAGIDWASKTHAVCVVDDEGTIRVRFEIPNIGKTFAGLVTRLIKLGVEGVAIERCDGPLVPTFDHTRRSALAMTRLASLICR